MRVSRKSLLKVHRTVSLSLNHRPRFFSVKSYGWVGNTLEPGGVKLERLRVKVRNNSPVILEGDLNFVHLSYVTDQDTGPVTCVRHGDWFKHSWLTQKPHPVREISMQNKNIWSLRNLYRKIWRKKCCVGQNVRGSIVKNKTKTN